MGPVSEYRDMLMDPVYEDTGLIVRLPLEWVLQNIVYSCDFYDMTHDDALIEMVSSKASDSGFGYLLDSILEKGFIRESPIGIQWLNGAEDWRGNVQGIYISEGHHRLTAAILLAEDYIWASAYGQGSNVNGQRISGHYHPTPKPVEIEF